MDTLPNDIRAFLQSVDSKVDTGDYRAAVAAYLVVLGPIEGQTQEPQQAIDQS